MTVAVLWRDGEVTKGADATDVLRQLLGGWNPNTIIELRDVLARRAGLTISPACVDDDGFLRQLDASGILTYQLIND
jgi:hypothetical protein